MITNKKWKSTFSFLLYLENSRSNSIECFWMSFICSSNCWSLHSISSIFPVCSWLVNSIFWLVSSMILLTISIFWWILSFSFFGSTRFFRLKIEKECFDPCYDNYYYLEDIFSIKSALDGTKSWMLNFVAKRSKISISVATAADCSFNSEVAEISSSSETESKSNAS